MLPTTNNEAMQEPNKAEEEASTAVTDNCGSKVDNVSAGTAEEGGEEWKPTWRFGMTIIVLSTAGLLTSLENTITGTALPTIAVDLNGADTYVWAVNAYTLTM